MRMALAILVSLILVVPAAALGLSRAVAPPTSAADNTGGTPEEKLMTSDAASNSSSNRGMFSTA